MAWKTSLLIFCQSVYETDWLQVYAQLFGFASSFFSFLKSQKLRRNFQAWRAVGSNDLFDAAWLLEADVGFLHLGYDDFSGANFSGGSVIFIVDNRVPRINSNITSLIFRDERNKGSLCHAPSIIRCLLLRKPFRTSSALLTGVRPSNVPLMNKTGMFDLTGARKLLPRSGLPHELQTSGNTMSAAFSKSVSLASRWILHVAQLTHLTSNPS